MKKILVMILIALAVFIGWQLLQDKPDQKSDTRPIHEDAPIDVEQENWPPINSKPIEYNNQTYRIYYFPLDNPKLVPNYQDENPAYSLVQKNKCTMAINGGFYEEDGSPLGLVKIDGKQLNPEVPNSNLITGFVWIDANNSVHIGRTFEDTASTVLQTGPFIGSAKPLSLVTDKQARRSAIVEVQDGSHFAVSVTFDELTTSGPFLKDLPPILFSDQAPFRAANAINLDGGAASYFYIKDDIELSELTSIGSLFCMN